MDLNFIKELGERYKSHRRDRREIIKLASDAQNNSKKSIFALHRDDREEADRLLAEAGERLAAIHKMVGANAELANEGSYRSALEEYMEAVLYRNFVVEGKVTAPEVTDANSETYIGALSDLTGELQRRQVKAGIERNHEEVARLKEAIEEIFGQLLDMDLEGYLRNKFDQAKNSLRRAEDVLYETSLRK